MTQPPTDHPDEEKEDRQLSTTEFLTRSTGLSAEVSIKVTTQGETFRGVARADLDAHDSVQQGKDLARVAAIATRMVIRQAEDHHDSHTPRAGESSTGAADYPSSQQ